MRSCLATWCMDAGADPGGGGGPIFLKFFLIFRVFFIGIVINYKDK